MHHQWEGNKNPNKSSVMEDLVVLKTVFLILVIVHASSVVRKQKKPNKSSVMEVLLVLKTVF